MDCNLQLLVMSDILQASLSPDESLLSGLTLQMGKKGGRPWL